MATRQTTLLLKRSNVIGKIPPLSGLTLGEMALNTADAKLYTLFTSGTTGATEVREIGWDRINRTGDTVTGDFNISGDVQISGSSLPSGYTLSVTGDTNLDGDVYVLGDLYYSGSVLVTGSTIIQDGLTANTIYTDYIDFNTGATVTQSVGRINWDSGTGTLNIAVGDAGTGLIDLQVGQEEIVRVYNSEGTTLQKGEVVYVFGSQGSRPSVKRALATTDGYSVTTLGMVDMTIPSGSEGYVTTFGVISNLNTLGLSGGTPIWLSPTVAGGYTSTKPKAPDHTVLLGYVIRVSATVGSIFVNISNGWELDELHDVRTNGISEGDLLLRSSYSGTPVWVNSKTLPGSYMITGNTNVGGNLTVTGNTTVNGNLVVSGNSLVSSGLTATTISATTYQNLPTDIRVTGGTYSTGTITFTNNTGGTFVVSGITAPTGAFGISDSGGVYTYYSTLSSAISAATAGQTVEMFADVTETTNVTVQLKHGITINGNGHTYTYTNNSGVMFTCATVGGVTGNIVIENINIVRSNTASTGASIFTFTGSAGYATTKLYFVGTFITYNVTSGNSPVITATDVLNTVNVDGLFCVTNGAGTAVTCSSARNSSIECTGTSNGYTAGTIRNSRITTTSGNGVDSATVSFCTITCTTSGIGVREGSAYDSNITTNTGNGMQSGASIAEGNAVRCVVTSTSGICFRRVIAQNCIASTGSNLVVDHWFNYNSGSCTFYRNYFVNNSATSPVISVSAGQMTLLDSTIIQLGTGPGVRVNGTVTPQEVINCTIIVASSSANCINATAAANVKYISNKYKGATTPVNANVTQQVINTADNQGNILL